MKRRDIAVRRWLFLGLVLATTAAATARLWAIFRVDGLTPLEGAVLALFAILFAWIASSFWIACLGTYRCWRAGRKAQAPPPALDRARAAIVMPVYNEDAESVFAGLAAMRESLREAGALCGFDFFVLSDSTDPAHCAAEIAAWRRMRRDDPAAGAGGRIYYRHRPRNVGRKSGNIAQFCENWGALYEYMVVLDADSLMTGETLARLVGRMDANPRAALIQVPPALVGGESLFARLQQFASSVYGPVHAAGLAALQGPDGNYWGHNAIIRIRPFMRHCGLPILPGRPPLGGEIMSHDFVEAALLRRAGWEVWLAPELGGSFEATPPTLLDHLKRDRRWCQGNLQHIKLIFAQGFRTPSRLHLALGVMSYLSSPIWLALLLASAVLALGTEHAASVTYVGRYPVLAWPISHTIALVTLVAVTLALLFGPKILSVLVLARDRRAVAAHGGIARLVLGVVIESVFSTLLAPIVMLSHSWFVFSVLTGRGTGWGGQQRGSRGIGLRAAARAFGPHTLVAVAVGLVTWYWIPASLWWDAPLLTGLALAIAICRVTSVPSWGAAVRRLGLLVIPSELQGLPVLDRAVALVRGRGAVACSAG